MHMLLTRRQILAGAAATAAVAAMPASMAIAAAWEAPFDTDRFIAACVEETERLHPGINGGSPGWAFVVNDATRPLLARLPLDMTDAGGETFWHLLDQSYLEGRLYGPRRWVGVTVVGDQLRIVGRETWSYRQALIDAGWPVEPL